MAIDPVTLAILKGRFEQIADEMDAHCFVQPSIQLLQRRMMPATAFMMLKMAIHLCKGSQGCQSLSVSWPLL